MQLAWDRRAALLSPGKAKYEDEQKRGEETEATVDRTRIRADRQVDAAEQSAEACAS